MAPTEEPSPDPRLDELLSRTGQAWPQSDEELDAWLAAQPVDAEEEAWLRDVLRRRIEAARGAELAVRPVGTPVDSAPALAGPVKPGAEAAARPAPALPRPRRPLTFDDLALLNGRLLELVEARVPLPSGLAACVADLQGGRLEPVMAALREDLEAGRPLSEAVARQGAALPPIYRTLVAAGEASGDLAGTLALLREQAEVDADMERRLRESLTYPATTLALSVIGMAAIGVLLVPRLRDLYDGLGLDLSLPSRALISGFAMVADHPVPGTVAFLALAAGGFVGIRRLLPRLVGGLVRGRASQRRLGELARALSGFLRRGAPLPAAVAALAEAYPDMAEPLGAARERLAGGATLAEALRSEGVFPPTFTWLVGAAEARGDLPEALHAIALRYEREFQGRVRLVETTVGPLVLVGIGLFVAWQMAAIYVPMFELQRTLQY